MEFPPSFGSRILPVPYFVQPTPDTCQSTCLKMMATYLEQYVTMQSTGASERDILQIWKDVNESPNRPSKIRNAHSNLKWWLEQRFPSLLFDYMTLSDEASAEDKIVKFINAGMPVLTSVSHSQVRGHIILVVGYENYIPSMSSSDSHLVVHDPFGKFDPTLRSSLWGVPNPKTGRGRDKGREGGMSLVGGGERGPGYCCRVPIASGGRQRKGMTGGAPITYSRLVGNRVWEHFCSREKPTEIRSNHICANSRSRSMICPCRLHFRGGCPIKRSLHR